MENETNYLGAIQTPSFTNVEDVLCGSNNYTILLLNDGTLKTFGDNGFGQSLMGNKTDYNGAIQTPDITNVKFVRAASSTIFVLHTN